MRRTLLWVLGVAVAGVLVAAEVRAANNDVLPIREIMLYKHGVGYFVRTGKVTDTQTVTLLFKTSQMNDLIKSLTAIDQGGSTPSIIYDSTKSVEHQLAEYTFDLRGEGGLPSILEQVKGSRVQLKVGNEMIEGVLLGIEPRDERKNDVVTRTWIVSVLGQAGAVRSVPLNEVSTFTFTDPRLQQDFSKYLEVLFSKHKRDEKAVNIAATGKGTRDLLVAYVTEIPVWKATYRVVLDEKKDPLLQGWAVVDNLSEEDWKDVKLTLVSGLPVSFIEDLYNPWYKRRPVVQVAEQLAMAPTAYEGGLMEQEKAKGEMALADDDQLQGGGRSRGAARQLAAKKDDKAYDRAAAAAKPQAPGFDAPGYVTEGLRKQVAGTVVREVGELFEYIIPTPVSIQKDHSALLPFVSDTVKGERVDIYNAEVRAENPMSAIRLRNTTKLTFEGGPMTVIENGQYVGESLIETLKPEEQRYISFAVDLGVKVTTAPGSKTEEVNRIIISQGVMQCWRKLVQTTAYKLSNGDQREKVVVIEHPVSNDFKLEMTTKPLETTPRHYRFEVKVPARKSVDLPVVEVKDIAQTYALSNMTNDQILLWIKQKYITEDVKKQLETIVALQRDTVTLQAQIRSKEREKSRLVDNLGQLRENLKVLKDTPDEKEVRSKWVKELQTSQDRITALSTEIDDLSRKLLAQQEELNKLVGNVQMDLKK